MGHLKQKSIYMPRKDKRSELKSWVSSLKCYILTVGFTGYEFTAAVLADTEVHAIRVAQEVYPDAKSWELSTAINRVIA